MKKNSSKNNRVKQKLAHENNIKKNNKKITTLK